MWIGKNEVGGPEKQVILFVWPDEAIYLPPIDQSDYRKLRSIQSAWGIYMCSS